MRVLVLCGVLAGCGRHGFEGTSDARARPDAGTADDDAPASACGMATTVPDPVTIAGQTFRYTDFDNSHVALGFTDVLVLDGTTGDQLAMTTSDAAGNYTVDVATGGAPRPIALVYLKLSWWTSNLNLDKPLDRSYTGPSQMLWQVGDAPLWNSAGMDSVYDTVSLTRNTLKGTINVAIRTCAGASIENVTIAVDPPPEAIAYTTTTGIVSSTGTQLPYSHAVVFNAQEGMNRITATAAGYTFPTLDVYAQAGTNNTLVILHPYE